MIQDALQAHADYPEHFKDPLALFDDELIQWLKKLSTEAASQGKVFVRYQKGRPLLAGNGMAMRAQTRKRLCSALRDLRNKFAWGKDLQYFEGVFCLHIDERGIVKDRFEFCGKKFIVVDGVTYHKH